MLESQSPADARSKNIQIIILSDSCLEENHLLETIIQARLLSNNLLFKSEVACYIESINYDSRPIQKQSK